MAANPIVYNTGGMFRFTDYVSQLPEFLREEEDVILLLQLFSDYINNAYRNLSVVEKFSFKLVASDATVSQSKTKLEKLLKLFEASESRGTTVLFVSKPQGNPYAGVNNGMGVPANNPIFKQYVNYAGTVDALNPSVATIPLMTGDKIYVNFTDESQAQYSAVYQYINSTTLILDPNNSSQDPFNQTSNQPFQTVAGLTPRMLEFNVSDISPVRAKRFSNSGGINYYEVYFSASITNIKNIPSSVAVEYDEFKYLVDYYNSVTIVPSVYSQYYNIKFANGCPNMDWQYNEDLQLINIPGYSLFYARPLTSIVNNTATANNKQSPTKYVDPIYNPNSFQITIVDIIADGGPYLSVTTAQPHKLYAGDTAIISNNSLFNGTYVVSSVTDIFSFKIPITTPVSATTKGGTLLIRNLYYSKYLNDANQTYLIIPYTNLISNSEIGQSQDVMRIEDEYPDDYKTFNADSSSVNLINYTIKLNEIPWDNGVNVTVQPADLASVLPSGLSENVQYPLYVVDAANKLVQFGDVVLGNVGSGTIKVSKVNRYFNASSGVNVNGNCITFSSVSGLKVGDYVMFTERLSTATLPTPLQYNYPYRIFAIDFDNKTVSFDGVDISAVGSGLVDIQLQLLMRNDQGVTLFSIPQTPLSTGNLVMARVNGDLISKGKFAVINNSEFTAIATINTNAVLWNGNSENVYEKGSYVVYPDSENIYQRYLVTKTDVIIPKSTSQSIVTNCRANPSHITPANQPNNKTLTKYVLDMDNITYSSSYLDVNPYMFGMYKTKSLNADETIDTSSGFANLSENLYIQKEQDLSLRYGVEQRNFLFRPRFSPPEILNRNGWLDIMSTGNLFDPVEQGVYVFVKANAVENIYLFGEQYINNPVSTIVVNGSHADVTTISAHGYKSGQTITLSGADQSIVNTSYQITVTGNSTYTITVPSGFPSTVTGNVTSKYFANVNDYINVTAQTDSGQNGIYVVKEDYWALYDADSIAQNTIIFTPVNMFDVSALNPESAVSNRIMALNASPSVGNSVLLNFNQPHNLIVNSVITVTGAYPNYYNGVFSVETVPTPFSITYKVIEQLLPLQSASGNIVVQTMGWYRYTLGQINWQQKTIPLTSYELGSNNSIYSFNPVTGKEFANNVVKLEGLYEIQALVIVQYFGNNSPKQLTKIVPNDGDIIELNDQLNVNENGVWRASLGRWKKLKNTVDTNPPALSSPLSRRLVAKVGNMTIDAYENESPSPTQLADGTYVPYIYQVYNDAEMMDFISQNGTSQQQIYIVNETCLREWFFRYESVTNIDTVGPFQKQYDANYDYNSVVNPLTMKSDWVGIPTMKYPLAEKIARLIYQKDPNVIDFELIGYLGRYLGYDITTVLEDIENSPYYTTDAEVDMALRKAIENLPAFYALKSTESGLQSLLLTFGIIGEMVTMWTETDDPYASFIPDYQIESAQSQNTASGKNISYIPTPHFKILANVEGAGFNQFLPGDVQRVIKSVKSYKPINTVFDGMVKYLQAQLSASIRAGTMRTVGKMQTSVGYDDLSYENISVNNFNNDCI